MPQISKYLTIFNDNLYSINNESFFLDIVPEYKLLKLNVQ